MKQLLHGRKAFLDKIGYERCFEVRVPQTEKPKAGEHLLPSESSKVICLRHRKTFGNEKPTWVSERPGETLRMQHTKIKLAVVPQCENR